MEANDKQLIENLRNKISLLWSELQKTEGQQTPKNATVRYIYSARRIAAADCGDSSKNSGTHFDIPYGSFQINQPE